MREKRDHVLIFIPNTLDRKNVGFLEGFAMKCDDSLAIFILNEKLLIQSSINIIGYCSHKTPKDELGKYSTDAEWVHINIDTGEIKVNNGGVRDDNHSVTCIEYDYNLFVKTETVDIFPEVYGIHLETLTRSIRRNNEQRHRKRNSTFFTLFNFLLLNCCTVKLKLFNQISPVVAYSAVLTQFRDSAVITKWIFETIKNEKKISLKTTNALIAKLVDLIFGLLVLFYVLKYEQEITTFVHYITQGIIENIKQLLVVLMGSPVGLKLNYAFSQNLGHFFLYHISLWEAFLQASRLLLRYAFKLSIIPGALGLTYQAALLSDLITFSTFHVYCIYVYATRLYWLQLRGLISLSKLFIGRKFNPLRNRVDSFQYTHNQLFIGTLAFTILLFLLPTTLLYYSVFTILRLTLVVLEGFLLRVRCLLQCLPFYIIVLWVVNSPKVKGSVYLKIIRHNTLHATLKRAPLWTTMIKSSPDILPAFPGIAWGHVARSICSGVLL